MEVAERELEEARAAIEPADEHRKRTEHETLTQTRERFAAIQVDLITDLKATPVASLREANNRLTAFTTEANALLGSEHALPIIACPAVDKLETWLQFVSESLRPKEQQRSDEGLEPVRILSFDGLRGLPPGIHRSNQRGDVVTVPVGVARELVKKGNVERVSA